MEKKLAQPSIWQRSLGILGVSGIAHQGTNKLQAREHWLTSWERPFDVLYHTNNAFDTGIFMGAAGVAAYMCGARSPYAIASGSLVGGLALNRLLESSFMKPVAEHFPDLVVSSVSDSCDFGYGAVAAVAAAWYIARAK